MAAAKVVTASIVIDFTSASGEGVLTAEVDSRETGYNGGDTQFYPGSTPYFLLFKSSTVVIDSIRCSEGNIVLISAAEVIKTTEYLTYANEKSASPQYPIGGASQVLDSAGMVGTPTLGETAVTFAAPQVCVVQVEYESIALAYQLTGASGLRPVVIYVAGHAP